MLKKLTDHIWVMPHEPETDRPALGYIVSGDVGLMVDSGNSPDHISLFYGNVRSIGLPDPEFIALTHWHWDHVFGLAGSPAKSIAHVLTNERLQSMSRWDWSDNALMTRVQAGIEIPFCAENIKKEMPMRHSFKVRSADISFVEQCEIRIEEICCKLIHIGGSHSLDSTVIYVPDEGVLFVGDIECEDLYTAGGVYRLPAYADMVQKLDLLPAEWIVPSHASPLKKQVYMNSLYHVLDIGNAVGDHADKVLACQAAAQALGRELSADEQCTVAFFAAGNSCGSPDSVFCDPIL